VKIRSERDSLAEVLATAGRAAGGRGGGSAVLSGLMLRAEGNRLEVTGTDLDLTIRVEQEVIGIEDGSCVVPGRLSADVVRALEAGAVTIEGDDEKVEISSARAHFGLRAFPSVEFPTLPGPPAPTVTVPRGALVEALRQVVRAASGDDARPLLTGVLMTTESSGVRLVATDSYRLAVRDLQGIAALDEGQGVLVPARALSEVQRLMPSGPGTDGEGPGSEIGIAPALTDITFTSGPVRVTTRLLEGTYPDYRQLIPDHYPNRLHVGRESLLAALRRVRLLVRDNTTPVRLSMRANGVDLSVVSPEIGDAAETVDGDYSGEDLVIAFNPSYLLDGVDAVLDDEVFIETDNPGRPATVRAASRDDFQYLLMPVRVT